MGFKNFEIRINDRRILKAIAAYSGFAQENYDNIFITLDKMDKIGLEGVEKELLADGYPQENIDKYLFSDEFELLLKEQLKKFNRVFSNISQELYGEKYALKYDKTVNKNGQQVYKFNAFNANMSTGKKQGEILCFDLAYILFADKEKIPCMHFLLNDKKELMHDNQLIKVAQYVQQKNIQLVVSILKDKLPEKVLEKGTFVFGSHFSSLWRSP